jgi:hypothetical protein
MTDAPDDRSLKAVSAQLARRWATQRLGAVQAYGRILADYGGGRASGTATAQAYARLVAEESVRYSADAFGIATDLATAVVRKAGGELESAARSAQPIQDLELSGPIGGTASVTFMLHNPHARPATLHFAPGRFEGVSGDVQASVILDPAKLELAAGAEQAITVSVNLDPAIFEVGGSYTATVAIAGFDDLVLRVRLSVLPA